MGWFSRSSLKTGATKPEAPKSVKKSDAKGGPTKKVDLLVPVMGLSGDGKSFFINIAADHAIAVTSAGMDPCTTTVHPLYTELSSGKKVAFIDTPGLDLQDDALDTVSAQILMHIFEHGRGYADAVIYLHRANRTTVTAPPKPEDIKAKFEKLCGSAWKKRVVFASILDEPDAHNREETRMKLKSLLTGRFGAEIEVMVLSSSHSNTPDAWGIIDHAARP